MNQLPNPLTRKIHNFRTLLFNTVIVAKGEDKTFAAWIDFLQASFAKRTGMKAVKARYAYEQVGILGLQDNFESDGGGGKGEKREEKEKKRKLVKLRQGRAAAVTAAERGAAAATAAARPAARKDCFHNQRKDKWIIWSTLNNNL